MSQEKVWANEHCGKQIKKMNIIYRKCQSKIYEQILQTVILYIYIEMNVEDRFCFAVIIRKQLVIRIFT